MSQEKRLKFLKGLIKRSEDLKDTVSKAFGSSRQADDGSPIAPLGMHDGKVDHQHIDNYGGERYLQEIERMKNNQSFVDKNLQKRVKRVQDAGASSPPWTDGEKLGESNWFIYEVLDGSNLRTLSVAMLHGTVVAKKNGVVVDLPYTGVVGDTIILTVTPDTDYKFTHWSDGDISNPRTITLSTNVNLSCVCEENSALISVTAEHGTVTGAGRYIIGSSCTLTFTPAEHYHFTQWSDGNTSNPRTFTVIESKVFSVSGVIDTHTITATATNGTVSGAGTYNYGSTATITFVPSEHYHFTQWSDGDTNNPRYLTVTEDVNLSTVGVIDTHAVTVTATNGTVTGAGTYNYGDTCTLTFTPNEHHHFTQWADGNTQNPRTFVVTESKNYSIIGVIDTHTVTVTATNGTVTGAGTYNYGSTANLVFTPSEHYHFIKWSDDNTENPRSLTVTGDVTLSVVGVIDTHMVTVTATNGSVTGAGTYEYGSSVTLTFTPDAHYHFTQWSDFVTDNPRTITVTSDVNLSVVGEIDIFTIALSCDHGSVTGAGFYTFGQICTISCIIDSGYEFDGWYEGTTKIADAESASFSVNGNRNLVAKAITERNYLSFTTEGSSTIKLSQSGADWSLNWTNVQYKIGDGAWQDYNVDFRAATAITVENNTIKWRGNKDNADSSSIHHLQVVTSGADFQVWGDITTLLNRVGGVTDLTPYGAYTFTYLFQSAGIKNAPDLSAITTLTKGCYEFMFVSSKISSATLLPATTLSEYCYNSMFSKCDNLTSLPSGFSLPATVLTNSCYRAMFYQSPVTTVPSLSHITTLAESCFAFMFDQTKVTSAPALPWNTVPNYAFQNMFHYCGQLATAGNLSATSIGVDAYQNMFRNCVALTGPINISLSTPLNAEGVSYAADMFNASGTNEGAGGIINVPDDPSVWNADNAGVNKNTAGRTVWNVQSTQTYVITATSEHGTITGAGTYRRGQLCTLVFVSDEHYHFDGWYEGTTKISEVTSISFVVNDNRTLVGKAVVDTHEVTVTATNGTVSGAGTYNYGDTCTLTFTPSEHYHFTQWSDGDTNNPKVFTVTENVNLSVAGVVDTYTVTATATHGTVTGAGNYEYGSSCTLTFVPSTGYKFVKWLKGSVAVSTQNPFTFTVESDIAFVAEDALQQYLIAATASNGTVSGAGLYNYGATCTLTFTPADHYHFTQWVDGDTNNPRSFTVTETKAFQCNGVKDVYTIVVATPEHGSVTGAGDYEYGAEVTLTYVPETGYRFVSWKDDAGEVVSMQNPYTFTAEKNLSLVVSTVQQVVIDVEAPVHGSVTGSDTYDVGEEVILKYIPDTGYHFGGWKVGGIVVSTANPYTFTAEQNLNFTIDEVANTYTVTLTTDHGNVEGSGTYEYGTYVDINWYDYSEEYRFKKWSDGSTENPRSLEVTGDITLVAETEENTFTVTVNATHGTVTGAGTYKKYEIATLIFTPETGYKFTKWADDNRDNPRTVIVENDVTYTVEGYKADQVISVNAINGSVTGAGNYAIGDTCTLTFTPAAGFSFEKWEDGCTDNPRTFEVTSSQSFTIWGHYLGFRITNTSSTGARITAAKYGSTQTYQNIQYSSNDGVTWTTVSANMNITINPGTEVCFKAYVSPSTSWDGGQRWSWGISDANASVKFSGDFSSMLNAGVGGITDISAYKGMFFVQMFAAWASEIDASEMVIPFTNYPNDVGVWWECFIYSKLKHGPQLAPGASINAKKLTFYRMFKSCSILEDIPGFTIGSVTGISSFWEMFRGCSSLKSLADVKINATNANENTYRDFCSGCTSLVEGPDLSKITTLGKCCFGGMFNGDTSLETVSNLPATTLVSQCYIVMFNNCNKLRGPIKIAAVTVPTSDTVQTMFTNAGNVSGAGGSIQVTANADAWVSTASITTPHTDCNWDVTAPISDDWEGFRMKANSTEAEMHVSIQGNPSELGFKRMQYCIDDKNFQWNDFTDGSELTIPAGKSICWRAHKNSADQSQENHMTFITDVEFNVSGDITSLLNARGGVSDLTNYGAYTFANLFDSSRLLNVPDLSGITTLSEGAYFCMFLNAEQMQGSSTILPASNVPENAYFSMFAGTSNFDGYVWLEADVVQDRAAQRMFANCGLHASEKPQIFIKSNWQKWVYEYGIDLDDTIMDLRCPVRFYNNSDSDKGLTWKGENDEDYKSSGWTDCYAISGYGSTRFGYGPTFPPRYPASLLIRAHNFVSLYATKNSTDQDALNYVHFTGLTTDIIVSGDLSSLLNGHGGIINPGTDHGKNFFQSLFSGQSFVAYYPEIPFDTLSEGALTSMFNGAAIQGTVKISANSPLVSGVTACSNMLKNAGAVSAEGLPLFTILVTDNLAEWRDPDNTGFDESENKVSIELE